MFRRTRRALDSVTEAADQVSTAALAGTTAVWVMIGFILGFVLAVVLVK